LGKIKAIEHSGGNPIPVKLGDDWPPRLTEPGKKWG